MISTKNLQALKTVYCELKKDYSKNFSTFKSLFEDSVTSECPKLFASVLKFSGKPFKDTSLEIITDIFFNHHERRISNKIKTTAVNYFFHKTALSYLSFIVDAVQKENKEIYLEYFEKLNHLAPWIGKKISDLHQSKGNLLEAVEFIFIHQALDWWASDYSLKDIDVTDAKKTILDFLEDPMCDSLNFNEDSSSLYKLPDIFNATVFKRLKRFNANEKYLSSLPKSFKYLTQLEDLRLNSNQFNCIPESIKYLTNLTFIDFSDNEICFIPEYISDFKNLIGFNFIGNSIEFIPESIFDLSKIELMYLCRNQITLIPPQIKKLTSLRILSLSTNHLSSISHEIKELPSLKQLYLAQNPCTNHLKISDQTNWIPILCIKETSFLYNEGEVHPIFLNLSLNLSCHQTIATWLNQAKKRIKNYTNEHSKHLCKTKIKDFLKQAEENEEFRGVFLNVIEEAASSCIDGLTLSLLHLNIENLQLLINPMDLESSYKTLSKIAIFYHLEKIAKKKIQFLKDQIDIKIADNKPLTQDQIDYGKYISVQRFEREIFLIYPARLKEHFDLPFDLTEMLFAACTKVTESDIENAIISVNELLADQNKLHAILIENRSWLKVLECNAPEEYMKIERKIDSLIETSTDLIKNRTELLIQFSIESITPAASSSDDRPLKKRCNI
jgi:Leucine-rich repeat (LRR) protein